MIDKTALNKKEKLVLEMYRQGMTQEQIGKKLGTFQGKVSALLKSVKKKHPELIEEIEEIKFRNVEKMQKPIESDWEKIAKELNIELGEGIY